MARTVLKYVFAALLALLCTQAVAPTPRIGAGIEIVCSIGTEQQALQDAVRHRRELQVRRVLSWYASRTQPEPTTVALFQRPPPAVPLFS